MEAASLRNQFRDLRAVTRATRTEELRASPSALVATSYNDFCLKAVQLFPQHTRIFPPPVAIKRIDGKAIAETTNAEFDWYCLEIMRVLAKEDSEIRRNAK